MPPRRPSTGEPRRCSDGDLRCYCFSITVGDLRRDGTRCIAFVEDKLRAGECDCARKNPTGRCCLGDLRLTASGSA